MKGNALLEQATHESRPVRPERGKGRALIRRWKAIPVWLRWAMVPVLALGLSVAWYLASPLFLNTTVNEPFPVAASARLVKPGDARRMAVVLRVGRFEGATHNGEGKATVYRLRDGRRILRLDPLKVTNGPNLYVYLSRHPRPANSDQLHAQGAFEVARLKGNIGPQNYELPATLDLARFRSVAIYCRMFHVVFSRAPLTGASQTATS